MQLEPNKLKHFVWQLFTVTCLHRSINGISFYFSFFTRSIWTKTAGCLNQNRKAFRLEFISQQEQDQGQELLAAALIRSHLKQRLAWKTTNCLSYAISQQNKTNSSICIRVIFLFWIRSPISSAWTVGLTLPNWRRQCHLSITIWLNRWEKTLTNG